MATVRLVHSIYTTDPETGEQQQLARQGQTAVTDRDCFGPLREPGGERLLTRWKNGVRIRVEGANEPIDVDCWNLEPVR